MAVPFSNTRLRVPKGFQNVLEGLAREVLRCQPENIYSFAADYFEELLRRRQETGYDDITLLGARLEDRFYNNHSFKNPNVNTNNDEQQSAAVKIQSEYRRFAAKKEVDLKKEEKAATVIQASVRGHLERQTHRSSSNAEVKEEHQENIEENNEDNVMREEQHTTVEDVQDSEVNTEENKDKQEEIFEDKEEEIDIDLNDPDVEKAAVKIQSAYKGFRNRKPKENNSNALDESYMATEDVTFETSKERLDINEEIDIDLNDPDVEKAAVKIQSVYKGFRTRKTAENSQVLHDSHHQNTEVEDKLEASDGVEHQQNTEDVEYHQINEDEDHLPNTEDENFEESQIVNEEHQPADEDNLENQESLQKENVVNTPDVTEKNEEIDEAQEAPVEEATDVTDDVHHEISETHEIVNENPEDKSQNIDSEVQAELQESFEITNMEESLVIEKDDEEVRATLFGEESSEISNEEIMDDNVIKEELVEETVVDEEIVKEDVVEEDIEEKDTVKEELVENIVVNEELVNDDIQNEELIDEVVEKEELEEMNMEVITENEEIVAEHDEAKPSSPLISDEVDNVNKSEVKEDVENESELPTDNLNNEDITEKIEVANEEILDEGAETERTIEVSNDLEDATTINNQESVQEIENPDHEEHVQESVLTDDAENADTNRTEPEE